MIDDTSRKTVCLARHLAWVVPQDGDLEGQVFSILDRAVLGCGSDVDIRIAMQGVRPTHAKIIAEGDAWLLLNEATDGSTRIGDRSLAAGAREKIVDGDSIKLGSASLIFKSL